MYLGLDLGTSGLRGLLVQADGDAVGSAAADYAVARPNPGWSEQNPYDWITACNSVVNQLRHEYSAEFSKLTGIGVAGHMHGAVLLDATGEVLNPCILWNDTRASSRGRLTGCNAGLPRTIRKHCLCWLYRAQTRLVEKTST